MNRRKYTKLRTANIERVYMRLLSVPYPTKPFCSFIDGKFLTGTQSKHRTVHARMWRTLLRLRSNRRQGNKNVETQSHIV